MLLTIMGTRPQYIKCAVLRSAYQDAGINEVLLDTGQHYDVNMTSRIFQQLNISEPEIKLSLGGQSRCKIIGSMIIELERVVNEINPKAIIVLGDTNSTLAGGLVAKKLGKILFHIEAGLRSYDKSMPEEQNRIIVDHISDQLFCPTQRAMLNLQSEGLKEGAHFTGDVMFDAIQKFQSKFVNPETISESFLALGFDLVTIHRADALASKEALQSRINYIRKHSSAHSRVFLVHPHTAKKLKEYQIKIDDFLYIEPQGYLETQWLLSRANHLFTDSGGMQKEAFLHGTPLTVLRNSTEWPEVFVRPENMLWENTIKVSGLSNIDNPFGNGDASSGIIEKIKEYL